MIILHMRKKSPNLSNLSLAERRGNNTRTSVRRLTAGRPIPCSAHVRKAVIPPYYLPPTGQGDASVGE